MKRGIKNGRRSIMKTDAIFFINICHLGIIIFLCACQSDKLKPLEKSKKDEIYDIKIDYQGFYSSDSLHLFIESDFEDDLVTIYVNHKVVISRKMTTIDQLGMAEYINLGDINSIQNIAFRINSGSLIYVEVDTSHTIMALKYLNQIAHVKFLEDFPFYD
jgi:hypothetical protein